MAEQQRRTTSDYLLRAQLDALTSQNTRLQEENNVLREGLRKITGDQRSAAALNVEAKIEALRLEDERDQMYDSLEQLKKKYNKLHGAYLEKVQRCKALEDTFKRQKTLSGLVMKSTLNQRGQDFASKAATENLEKQVVHLQTALDEAYDIIDELEFELESIDYLEQENQRMRNELFALKSKQPAPQLSNNITRLAPFSYTQPPLSGETDATDGASGTTSKIRAMLRPSADSSSNESLPIDDANSETLERAAMTQSLIDNAAVESIQLRRELLKSRLQNTVRPK